MTGVVLETLPLFYRSHPWHWVFFSIEAATTFCFTIEFFLRFVANSYSCKSLFKFFWNPLNAIDFLSFAPFYVELFLIEIDLRHLTVFRILRLVRVLKLSRYSVRIQILMVAIRKSREVLAAIFFLFSLLIVFFSSVIYYVERGVYDPELKLFINVLGNVSSFQSIPATMWFVIVS